MSSIKLFESKLVMLLPEAEEEAEEEEKDAGESCSGAVSAAAKLEPSAGDIIKF